MTQPESTSSEIQHPNKAPLNKLSIVSFIAACAFIVWFPIPAIVAVITGHIALHQIKQTGQRGSRYAKIGVIVGYAFIAVFTGFLIYAGIGLSNGGFKNIQG